MTASPVPQAVMKPLKVQAIAPSAAAKGWRRSSERNQYASSSEASTVAAQIRVATTGTEPTA
jgi:hypothetical protein